MADVTLDRVTKDYEGGVRVLESLDLRVTDAELVALVGPSGCGKSTILKLIAGLEEVTDGTVEIGGRVMNGVGPGERDVAMVFQNYALYPHMTVRDNIAFGLRMRGLGKAARYRQVEEVAGILDLEPYLDRRPSALSGGQRQRVAMGRAMVREPAVFLLDEPLSNLDAKLRVKMRADIAELQKRLAATMVFVTHDQVEAMTMADRVVVLDRGIVQQAGTPMELYRRPANLFVAGFIGSPAVNLLRGELTSFEGRWRLRYGRDGEHLDLGTDVLPAAARELTSLVLGIRPESVHIDSSAHESERVLGRVRLVEVLGDETLVHASVNAAPVSVGGATGDEETEAELSPDEARFVSREHEALAAPELGAVVPMRVDLERLMVFDPATGVRLG